MVKLSVSNHRGHADGGAESYGTVAPADNASYKNAAAPGTVEASVKSAPHGGKTGGGSMAENEAAGKTRPKCGTITVGVGVPFSAATTEFTSA